MTRLLLLFLMGWFASPAAAAQTLPGEGEIIVAGRIVGTLQQAFNIVPDGGVVQVGPGTYRGARIERSDILVLASPRAVIDGGPVDGKAALVIKGNNVTIDGLTCQNITVPSRNGACIRHESQNLTLKNVTFRDSESGILAGEQSRNVLIEDSDFINLGKEGRAHAIYINGGELTIRRSRIVGSKDQAHGIKSRCTKTIIEKTLVASAEANDSRLIDLPNGGENMVTDSLLIEGPNSVNWSLFSYGVEGNLKSFNTLRIERNTIISDRPGGAVLVQADESLPPAIVGGNVVVGNIKYDWPSNNFRFSSREEAGLPASPQIPDWDPRGSQ